MQRDPRLLPPLEVLDVYVVGRIGERVRISEEAPLLGELMRDAAGSYFLSPQEDERGEGMAAVAVPGLDDPRGFGLVGRTVAASGIFDPARGLEVATLRAASRGFRRS
jgi:hypothetical protein